MLKAKGLEPLKTLPAIHDCVCGWMLPPRPLARTKYLDPHSSLFPSSSPPVQPFEVIDTQPGTIVMQQGRTSRVKLLVQRIRYLHAPRL